MNKKPSFFEWISKVLKISEKIEKEVSKIRFEMKKNNSNNEEINLLIKKEIDKIREELKKQVTKEVTKEVVEGLLKKNLADLKDNLVLRDDLDKVIVKHLEMYSTDIKTNIESSLEDKLDILIRKSSDSLVRSGDTMAGEIKYIQEELEKTINTSNQEVISNISVIIKEEVNSLKSSVLEELKKQDTLRGDLEKDLKDQEERYKLQEEEYSKILKKKEIEFDKNSTKLSKYEGGLSSIKNLLLSLDNRSLAQVKDSFYSTYQLIDEDTINNYIKIALEDKASIINDTLICLRNIKIESEDEVDSDELEFYKAINKFYGNEIVLLEKLNDKEIVRKFWDVDGNGHTLQKKIFPPLDLGDDILRGVAECGY